MPRPATASASRRAGVPQKDRESVVEELAGVKQRSLELARENSRLKASVQRLQRALKRADAKVQKALKVKVEDASRVGDVVAAGALQDLKADLASARIVSDKAQELEAALAAKERELAEVRNSVKFTSVREAQVSAETYLAEARRLKIALGRARRSKGGEGGGEEAAAALRMEMEALRLENARLRADASGRGEA